MKRNGALHLAGLVFLLTLLWIALATGAQASSADATWPSADGTVVDSNGKLVIDESHMSEGYVMCRLSSPSGNRMKMRVTFSSMQLIYDLNQSGNYEAFPLQLGSGSYQFELMENVKGNKYSLAGRLVVNAQLIDRNAAYLVPNQYVNYSIFTDAVKKSDELTANITGQQDIFKAVTNFMEKEFTYDFVRAATISSGQLPDITGCYNRRSGICQDLSAVLCCMLRVQGIPCKLVIGYVNGSYYHAWTLSILDGQEVFYDPTAALGCLNASSYSVERMY